jgi:hypothetical protein
MLGASTGFRRLVQQNSKTLFKATLTLADETVRELTGDDIMMGTAAFSTGTSSDGSFDIGAAIIGRFDVSLNNMDGRFDAYDFTGATIVPFIGVELPDDTVEWLRKGVFNVEQPASYGGTIALSALDNLVFLERPYSDVSTAYPATLTKIVSDICAACGVTLLNQDFANGSYSVATRPDDATLTCLDVLSYAAQASGNFAGCDTLGRLALGWYDTTAFEDEGWLDGGSFDASTPHATGDDADGGDFSDYDGGDDADGGSFSTPRFAHVHAIAQETICTDDVVVTGVRVTAQDEVKSDGMRGDDGESSLYGSAGYVVSVEGNPLILFGKASAVAAQVGPRVVGMRFRPFDLSAVGDPTVEAGDPVVITDRAQNRYLSYLTSLTYKVGEYAALSCGAETPSRNSAAFYSAITRAVVESRKAIKAETTARKQAVEALQLALSTATGIYKTEQTQQDGSTIYYMHDKPTLAASTIVWKLTAEALAVSGDGGSTYPYGLDVSGNAILNRIYAVGIDADYLTTGALSVKSGNTEIFRADVAAGTFMVNTSNFKVTPAGVITATSGTIGGLSISGDAIYKYMESADDSETVGIYIDATGDNSPYGMPCFAASNGVDNVIIDGRIYFFNYGTNCAYIAAYTGLDEHDRIEDQFLDIYAEDKIRLFADTLSVIDADDTEWEGLNRTEHTLRLANATKWNTDTENSTAYTVYLVEDVYVNGLLVERTAEDTTRGFYSAAQVDTKLSDMATKTWVNNKNYLTSSSLSGYATQTWVNNKNYLTSSSLSGYATQSWVSSQGYLTSSSLSGYATQSWVSSQGYITSASIPSVPSFSRSGSTLYITL